MNTTERTDDATLIQTPPHSRNAADGEIESLSYQVPRSRTAALYRAAQNGNRTMHALEEYGVMQVKLYEDIARFGHITATYAYPVKVNGRYVMDPCRQSRIR
ncbi:alpha-D-ribose 1-methylphosphonate 5-phosphate C-P-lyase PhnJ [Escherichia coli]